MDETYNQYIQRKRMKQGKVNGMYPYSVKVRKPKVGEEVQKYICFSDYEKGGYGRYGHAD